MTAKEQGLLRECFSCGTIHGGALCCGPIERDPKMERDYIPMPGGWEIQTKGKGSTFRICDKDGDRLAIPDSPYLHETLERMARDVNAAALASDTGERGVVLWHGDEPATEHFAWECKIGAMGGFSLPNGADLPMRQAVKEAFGRITGMDAEFCFSGWAAKLTEQEMAVVENRLPKLRPLVYAAALRAQPAGGGEDDVLAERAALLNAGGPLANIAFNLAQSPRLTADERDSLDKCRKAWDAACLALVERHALTQPQPVEGARISAGDLAFLRGLADLWEGMQGEVPEERDPGIDFCVTELRSACDIIAKLSAIPTPPESGGQGDMDYTPGVLDSTAPPRIWLQVDTSASNDERDEAFPSDFEGVTWQDESIGGLEVQYVRADLAQGGGNER